MQIDRSPFLKLQEQQVLGYFKQAGSRDPDVLHSHKANLITLGRFPKLTGIYVMVMGALLTVTILGAFIGIPLMGLGWWMMQRGKSNLKVIESGFAAFQASGVGAP